MKRQVLIYKKLAKHLIVDDIILTYMGVVRSISSVEEFTWRGNQMVEVTLQNKQIIRFSPDDEILTVE